MTNPISVILQSCRFPQDFIHMFNLVQCLVYSADIWVRFLAEIKLPHGWVGFKEIITKSVQYSFLSSFILIQLAGWKEWMMREPVGHHGRGQCSAVHEVLGGCCNKMTRVKRKGWFYDKFSNIVIATSINFNRLSFVISIRFYFIVTFLTLLKFLIFFLNLCLQSFYSLCTL